MAQKKASVKWNVPEIKDSKTPWTDHDTQHQNDTVSEQLYSDTFEDTNIDNLYSNTFMTESYSDTFVNSSVDRKSTSRKTNPVTFKFVREADSLDLSDTDQIQTVITEGIQTIIEVDSESEFPGTAIDTELHETVGDTFISDSHPTESYSDTFESADKTRTDFELRTESADSHRSMITASATFSETPRSLAETVDSEDDLDRSYIAPDYDGKSMIDDEYDTDQDNYTDTFEPTELTTQLSETDKGLPEEPFNRQEKQAQTKFIQQLLGRFKDKELVKDRGLQVISPDLSEESEDEYLKHFCKKKVKQMKRRRRLQGSDISEMSDENQSRPRPLAGDLLSEYGLQDTVLERAKLTNILSAMKKAARKKIHEVDKCPECSKLKADLEAEEARKVFTESRAKWLKSKMMDIHVENHLLRMNSISMIAELARQLPRSSERPEKIMDQLLEPLLGKNVMR